MSNFPRHSIFLPVRAGSQRVPKKNVRRFADLQGGLVELKLRQMCDLPESFEIVLSSDDETAIEIARGTEFSHRIEVERRPDWLCTSEVALKDLIRHVPRICRQEWIIWTHVTSPFFDSRQIQEAAEVLHEASREKYDSLMSVTKMQKYLWDGEKGESINYDHSKIPWPSTQTLPRWFEVNSGLFIAKREAYELREDRIGSKPLCWENDWLSSIDVDWEEDFTLAETLYRHVYRA